MVYRSIGTIYTPYSNVTDTPYQPIEANDQDERQFCIEVTDDFAEGLERLDSFKYAYVLYHVDRLTAPLRLRVTPPWIEESMTVGLFASRSPLRPNPIGLSVVRIFSVEANRVYTSPLDVFNGTPLLDIKPYLRDLDSKNDANYGWLDELPDRDHLILHIKGIPHSY